MRSLVTVMAIGILVIAVMVGALYAHARISYGIEQVTEKVVSP